MSERAFAANLFAGKWWHVLALVLFGATITVTPVCERSDPTPSWWKRARLVDSLADPEQFSRTVLAAKDSSDHLADVMHLAKTVEGGPQGPSDFALALMILATDEKNSTYLDAARTLDQRFPEMPGTNLIITASVMQGEDALRVLHVHLFEEWESAEWPFSYWAVAGLRDHRDWLAEDIPPFEDLIDRDWPLLGRLALISLLVHKKKYACEPVLEWILSIEAEAPQAEHPRLVAEEIAGIREMCR